MTGCAFAYYTKAVTGGATIFSVLVKFDVSVQREYLRSLQAVVITHCPWMQPASPLPVRASFAELIGMKQADARFEATWQFVNRSRAFRRAWEDNSRKPFANVRRVVTSIVSFWNACKPSDDIVSQMQKSHRAGSRKQSLGVTLLQTQVLTTAIHNIIAIHRLLKVCTAVFGLFVTKHLS